MELVYYFLSEVQMRDKSYHGHEVCQIPAYDATISIMDTVQQVTNQDIYLRLIALLDQHHATYRTVDHDPEGQPDLVSAMRGHHPSEAAKCVVVIVKVGKKITKYVLAVVPGDKRVSVDAIKALYDGSYVSFATPDIAERLAGSVPGTILPFSFNPELELLVDPSLLQNHVFYFNAARLDRSLSLATIDYLDIAQPRIEEIVQD
jgi:Ala-tRNA(Pro) deacylase